MAVNKNNEKAEMTNKTGEVNEVLRVQDNAKDIKATNAQVKQHGLALAPL
jgi:hypothetical protein